MLILRQIREERPEEPLAKTLGQDWRYATALPSDAKPSRKTFPTTSSSSSGSTTENLNWNWYERNTGRLAFLVPCPFPPLMGFPESHAGPSPFSSMNSTPAASHSPLVRRAVAMGETAKTGTYREKGSDMVVSLQRPRLKRQLDNAGGPGVAL
jgi:hypothetical protein